MISILICFSIKYLRYLFLKKFKSILFIDCKRKRFEKFPFYFLTFMISTLYVALLTYGLVWMVVIIAFRINIPDTVAGLTVLAAGTSLPEVVSSIIITRKGKGEMAMSNSIGSNVFDILVCLGLPWFLENTIIKPFTVINVYSGGIFYSSGILLCSIIILMACFIINKWMMSKKFGILMFIIWIFVTIITCLFEYDVFGKFSVPLC
jgi:sodium/potassium/calcium exchanger 4